MRIADDHKAIKSRMMELSGETPTGTQYPAPASQAIPVRNVFVVERYDPITLLPTDWQS